MLLGNIDIPFPYIQAALSGYSDAPMRKIARQFGCQFAMCEVMLDQFVIAVSKRKSKLYFADTDEHPIGAQLMGSEPAQFVQAAKRLVNEGFDLIDLNFACPVKKVLGRKRGGYLLNSPATALDIVEAVRTNIPGNVPLTVKLRRGFDDTPQSRSNFFTILDGVIQRGVCGITLHGRTVKQRYEGNADWNCVKEVRQYLDTTGHHNITLIGSGDLFTADVCRKRLNEMCSGQASRYCGLALARGVIGNPWLFRKLSGGTCTAVSLSEQRAVIAEHFRLSAELYGEKRAATTMRAFGVKYSQLHPEPAAVRQAFCECKTAADWQTVLKHWY